MTQITKMPIRVGLVLAAFPSENATAFKYFLLLLNRLQTVFEFQFHDPPRDNKFVRFLSTKGLKNPDETRDQLLDFARRLRAKFDLDVEAFDLSTTYVSQIIIISLATL